ncbi:hypothetical protein V2I01_29695 [Micromonospora sp. BRA006-A]|nr:hypothetical protein [Micromonospora sp. BRA006-A]
MRLARRDPAVRTRLVEMFPEPPGWSTDVTDFWLAVGGNGHARSAADEAATVSAARWLERLMALRERRSRPAASGSSVWWRIGAAVAGGGPAGHVVERPRTGPTWTFSTSA